MCVTVPLYSRNCATASYMLSFTATLTHALDTCEVHVHVHVESGIAQFGIHAVTMYVCMYIVNVSLHLFRKYIYTCTYFVPVGE